MMAARLLHLPVESLDWDHTTVSQACSCSWRLMAYVLVPIYWHDLLLSICLVCKICSYPRAKPNALELQ
jgi:hypothetical protein